MTFKASVIKLHDKRTLTGTVCFDSIFVQCPAKDEYIYRTLGGHEYIYRVVAVIHRVNDNLATHPEVFVEEISKMQLRDEIDERDTSVAAAIRCGLDDQTQVLQSHVTDAIENLKS